MSQKQQDKGASSGEDRAVVNGAASASALRASVPSAEYPPDCPSWYSVSLCGKCRKCECKLAAMAAKAAPHADLIAEQTVRHCRLCTRIERYCQTDGQGRGKHAFAPVLTCESCVHMGGRYWGSDDRPIHHCHKSGDRRAANFKSTGDFSQDFMDEFRKFYDAGPHQSAECCSFFEPRQSAQAIEAGTAEPVPVSACESAVGEADAPERNHT